MELTHSTLWGKALQHLRGARPHGPIAPPEGRRWNSSWAGRVWSYFPGSAEVTWGGQVLQRSTAADFTTWFHLSVSEYCDHFGHFPETKTGLESTCADRAGVGVLGSFPFMWIDPRITELLTIIWDENLIFYSYYSIKRPLNNRLFRMLWRDRNAAYSEE